MRRAAALVGAVAMVVAALVFRGIRDDGDDGTGGPSAAGLLCVDELTDVCRAAGETAARTERAGATADRLIALEDPRDLDVDAWIVPAAWARLVIAERDRLGRGPLFEPDPAPLASTGLLVPVWTDRAQELEASCGSIDWTCLADRSGTALAGGDRVRIASPDVDTASGLVVAAWQAAGLVGATDFAANDFDATFRSRAGALAAGQHEDPLTRMRTRGPGEVTAAAVPATRARLLTSNFGAITPAQLPPPVRLDVVVLVRAGASFDRGRRDALVDALVEAGFGTVEDDLDGLPAGGVLAAVRSVWNDNR